MSLYYADTSAVIKLLMEESHSTAFAGSYDAHADAEWVSPVAERIMCGVFATVLTRALSVRLLGLRGGE